MTAEKVVHPPFEAEGWVVRRRWRRLDELSEGVFDCPHSTPILTEVGPLIARSQDVRTGRFLVEEAGHISDQTYLERIARAEPREGDLLYSREGTYFGIAAEVPKNVRVCLGQRMVLIRPSRDRLDHRFLRFWLNSPVLSRHLHGFRDGTVAERLNMPTIRALPVPVFDLSEQQAIASILGSLDDKIDLNRRMNETLEAMARAIFKDWFVDFGPVRAKMEGREPYLAPELWNLFPAQLDKEGNPHGWRTESITAFLSIIGGGTPKTSNPEFWSGSIPWFSVVDTPALGNVFVIDTEKKITPAGLASSAARLIPKGTTIISARGTVGNLAIAGRDITFNQSCYGLQRRDPIGDYTVFLVAGHVVERLRTMAHGSVFSTITRQTFEAVSLPLPPPHVALALEKLLTPLFDRIYANVEESMTLSSLRDLLLPKMMSGEIRIQDAERIVEAVA